MTVPHCVCSDGRFPAEAFLLEVHDAEACNEVQVTVIRGTSAKYPVSPCQFLVTLQEARGGAGYLFGKRVREDNPRDFEAITVEHKGTRKEVSFTELFGAPQYGREDTLVGHVYMY